MNQRVTNDELEEKNLKLEQSLNDEKRKYHQLEEKLKHQKSVYDRAVEEGNNYYFHIKEKIGKLEISYKSLLESSDEHNQITELTRESRSQKDYIENLETKLKSYEKDIDELQKENNELKQKNDILIKENNQFIKQIKQLKSESEIKILKESNLANEYKQQLVIKDEILSQNNSLLDQLNELQSVSDNTKKENLALSKQMKQMELKYIEEVNIYQLTINQMKELDDENRKIIQKNKNTMIEETNNVNKLLKLSQEQENKINAITEELNTTKIQLIEKSKQYDLLLKQHQNSQIVSQTLELNTNNAKSCDLYDLTSSVSQIHQAVVAIQKFF
ncbi:hypothetical protein QTN25_005164 [Entamoeba marina]